MKEPKRLLSHGASDFERQLLRAVANERPSALLRSRMQRGLGLVGPLAWASNVKAMFGTLGSRVTAGLAVTGVVIAGGVAAVTLSGGSTTPAGQNAVIEQSPASESTATRPSASETLAPSTAPSSPPVAEVEPPSVEPQTTPAPSERTSITGDDDSQLREEIALLDAARAALQRADRDSARTTLNAYRERFPNGILRREARVLWSRTEAKPERPPEGD
jgi:hypothetical protein